MGKLKFFYCLIKQAIGANEHVTDNAILVDFCLIKNPNSLLKAWLD